MLGIWLLALLLSNPAIQAQTAYENSAENYASSPEPVERFDITELPKGASVVLPHPASTVVPLDLKLHVSATDKKQLLKIGALSSGGVPRSFQLAIYDQNQSRVRYLTIKPGNFAVYHFKNLSTIHLVPQNPGDPALKQMKLLLESNRPLEVGY